MVPIISWADRRFFLDINCRFSSSSVTNLYRCSLLYLQTLHTRGLYCLDLLRGSSCGNPKTSRTALDVTFSANETATSRPIL